jgi:hypothetical protein
MEDVRNMREVSRLKGTSGLAPVSWRVAGLGSA